MVSLNYFILIISIHRNNIFNLENFKLIKKQINIIEFEIDDLSIIFGVLLHFYFLIQKY